MLLIGKIELTIGMKKPKTSACTVANAVGKHETWMPVSDLKIAWKIILSIGIAARYPQMIEGITNKKLCTRIMEIQFALLSPISRRTPVSKVFVSTDIISRL